MRPILDAWIEGYLDYQLAVRRLTPRSVVDVRCTLRRAVLMMVYSRKFVCGVNNGVNCGATGQMSVLGGGDKSAVACGGSPDQNRGRFFRLGSGDGEALG